MLAAITYQVRDALEARGVPYPVSYGPERTGQTSMADPHIVIERDRDQGDGINPATTNRRNPQLVFVRPIGAVFRVYARSTLPSAGPADHERVADKVVDQILVVLREIVAARKTFMRFGSAGLLTAAALEELSLQTWSGVVYQVRFQVDRGVTTANYEGEIAAESEFGDSPGTSVSTTLDTDDSPEVNLDLPSATTRTD